MSNHFPGLLKKALYNGFLIPVIYLVVMTLISRRYHLFVEWDGVMHYFSSVDIYQGRGYLAWPSHFWPPLYPVLIGLLAKVMPGFEAAKLISTVSAALLLLVVHRFTYRLSGNVMAACLAQLLVATNYTFVLMSVQAENHMLDALFYVWAILLLLQILDVTVAEKGGGYRYALIGMVCGLAGLSRYTSYALLPAFMLTLFCFYPFRRAASCTFFIMLGFSLVSSPWWIVNYQHNGSPFATWQYMNIGMSIFGSMDNKWWWCWSGVNAFNSVGEIFLQAPVPYINNFCRNLLKGLALTVYRGQLAGGLCAIAVITWIGYSYYKRRASVLRSKTFLPLVINLACYLVLVSQAFVFGEVFLAWVVLMIIYGVYTFDALRSVILPSGPAYKMAVAAAIMLVAGVTLLSTTGKFRYYMSSIGGMEDNAGVVSSLKEYDPDIDKKVIMCFHPGRAYHLGSGYIMMPLYYTGDLNGLVTFKGLSEKVREYAPRFPASLDIDHLKADYLIFDRRAASCLPQFAYLLERGNRYIPRNFQLVYLSHWVAVYKIN